MAGLFGLFGGGKKGGGKKGDGKEVDTAAKKKQTAYYLDADSAKTLGDIDYMRSTKVIKHKFPKTLSNQAEFERVESVSAMGKMKDNGVTPPPTPVLENGSTAQWQPTATNNGNASMNNATSNGTSTNDNRRKADSNMDMFRDMAREIRKR
jgi:hypothetical protein